MEDAVFLFCEMNIDDEDKCVQILKKFIVQSHALKEIALSEPKDTATTLVVHFMLRAARASVQKKNAVCIRNLLRCAIFATKHQSLQDECQVNKSKIPPDPVFGAKSSGFGLLSEHKLKNGTVLYDVLETSVNVVVRQKKTRQVGFQGFDLGTGFILLNKSKKKKDKPMLFMMNHQVSYHTFFDLHSPPHHSFPPLPSLILGRPEL